MSNLIDLKNVQKITIFNGITVSLDMDEVLLQIPNSSVKLPPSYTRELANILNQFATKAEGNIDRIEELKRKIAQGG